MKQENMNVELKETLRKGYVFLCHFLLFEAIEEAIAHYIRIQILYSTSQTEINKRVHFPKHLKNNYYEYYNTKSF